MSTFNIRDVTPYITFFGPIAGFIAIWDFLLRDVHKATVWDGVVSLARLGRRPVSLAFYGFVTLASAVMTIAILSISGIAASKSAGGSAIIGLKSSAPLLLAVILKILVFDYFLALKSFAVVRVLGGTRKKVVENGGKGTRAALVFGALFIAYDIYFTAVITASFLNWSEVFQSVHVGSNATNVPAAIKPAVDFFDSINFLAKESVQKSFYALNGTLLMYGALFISAVTDGVVRYLNVEDIKKNVFKILAAGLVFLVLVVAVARHWR